MSENCGSLTLLRKKHAQTEFRAAAAVSVLNITKILRNFSYGKTIATIGRLRLRRDHYLKWFGFNHPQKGMAFFSERSMCGVGAH